MEHTKDVNLKKSIPYVVKTATANIQDVDMTKRIVTGFYNSYNYFDGGRDVLLMGCAAKSIADRGPDSTSVQKIKHLVDHNWTKLPGKIQVLQEKTLNGITGIYFETKMANTTLGNDTLINYQEKIYDNHSIGFQYLDIEYIDAESKDWVMYLNMLLNPSDAEKVGYMYVCKEVKLYEGSTVAFGENSLTPYLGVKSQNKEALALKINDRIGLLEKQLKSGTQSDDALQSFEMQLVQLKQLVNEIFTLAPSPKDTLIKGRTDHDTKTCLSVINFGSINHAF